MCSYTPTSSELQRGSIKLINTSHSRGSVTLPSSSPLSLHQHHCHCVPGLTSIITFSSSSRTIVSSLRGTGVGEIESLSTKLGSPHLLPWAGSPIPFLVTPPPPGALHVAKNQGCTGHNEAAQLYREEKPTESCSRCSDASSLACNYP